MCPEHARFGILPSPLLSPQSRHPNHLSKHLLNAAQVIHMGAQPVHMCPNPAQPSVHVLTVQSQCTCAQSPASNHGTIWRTTCSYATGAKVTRGVVSAPGGHSCSKTPPYQLISSRGKDKQKELACSESICSI